jgi:hypothetical protein
MANYKKWTNNEIEFIKENHSILCDETLAARLSEITNAVISISMIRRQRRKLALKKPRGRPAKNKNTTNIVN